MKQIRRHLTYANVMSSLAVFMVLGGATAFAATKIGANEIKANSIKTGKIVKEAVTAGKIKKNAVTESRIADKAVTTNKLADNAVTTAKIADLAVTTGKIANDAVNGEKVNESTLSQVPSAKVAETAAPQAYARVLNNTGGLGVDEARSKGVTDASVTFVGGSVYCFELGFTPTNIQSTVDWIGGGANTFAQATLEPFNNCPAGSDASVRTTNDAGAGIGTINFYVQFVG